MAAKVSPYLLWLALLGVGMWAPGNALALVVNQMAPDFTLPSTTGEPITLSQFRDKKMVLIEFYAIDFGTT